MGKVINGKTEEQINIEKQEENAASIASLAQQTIPFDAMALSGTLLDGKQNVVINVIGDSTGNATTEWVYLLGQKLAAAYPGYNVKYALYDAANERYGAFQDIQNVGVEKNLRYNQTASNYYTYRLEKDEIPLTSGDLDIAIELAMDDWDQGTDRTLIGRFNEAGSYCFRIQIHTTNEVVIRWSENGTDLKSLYLSGFNTSALTDGEYTWLRIKFDTDNGASGHTGTLYTSTDGITWTQVGTRTTEGATSIYDHATQPWELGGYKGTATRITAGNVRNVVVRDGIDGEIVSYASIDSWRPHNENTKIGGVFEGTPTIYIYNGCIAGQSMATADTRLQKLVRKAVNPIFIYSLSHNDKHLTGKVYIDALHTFIEKVKGYTYNPNIILHTQNPRLTPAEWIEQHSQRRLQMLSYAKQNKYGAIDSYLAYLQSGVAMSTLIDTDGIHPIAAGLEVSANSAFNYFKV